MEEPERQGRRSERNETDENNGVHDERKKEICYKEKRSDRYFAMTLRRSYRV